MIHLCSSYDSENCMIYSLCLKNFCSEIYITRLINSCEGNLQKSGHVWKMTFFFHFSCKMQSDLRRHREFHNAVLAHHCDFEGCNFSARAMQTVKRHQKVDHQVGSLSNITNRYQWIARCFVFFLSSVEIQLEHHETQLEPRSWKFSRSKGLST